MCILSSLILFFVAIGLGNAQTKPTLKYAPLNQTSAASGKEMFANYCASCHGANGKGVGPATIALKTAPPDLTRLAAKNRGVYPEAEVARALQANDVTAHGSQEMPIWGDLFKVFEGGSEPLARLRISNLSAYIKSIQGQ
jgi:mono/diheme cytochrome c family protein